MAAEMIPCTSAAFETSPSTATALPPASVMAVTTAALDAVIDPPDPAIGGVFKHPFDRFCLLAEGDSHEANPALSMKPYQPSFVGKICSLPFHMLQSQHINRLQARFRD